MSYDVTVGGEWFNYTSNMSKFFRDFDVYPPDWDGIRRYALSHTLKHGLANINSFDRAALAKKYDAENGWGSVDSAIDWLERIYEASVKELDIVEVSW